MDHDYKTYHTHHQSRRLAGWDYTQAAACFVTVCTRDRECRFGAVESGRMFLNAYGRIAAAEWGRSKTLRDEVHLDTFVVVPNHVHGIVVIAPPDAPANLRRHGLGSAGNSRGSDMARHVATSSKRRFGNPETGSLGTIVGAYKSAVIRRINRMRGTSGAPVWQRGYYDHILRDEREWRRVRRYIRQNPARWHADTHFSTKR